MEEKIISVEDLIKWHDQKGGPNSDDLDDFYLLLDEHHKGIGYFGDDGGVDIAYQALPIEAKREVTKIILKENAGV
jgi:hypothetical protein